MSSPRLSWVLLAYRVPREPSTPRSALWRKLRRLGAAQVVDGLAALPLDARNREQLEWLADEGAEAGGGATRWGGGRPPARFSPRPRGAELAPQALEELVGVVEEPVG